MPSPAASFAIGIIIQPCKVRGANYTMFVAHSRFTVANQMIEEVKQAFRDRPHLVDKTPGFVRLDVISPLENPEEIWLITYWEDENSFTNWRRSHRFRESHKWIPKGLKLVPKSVHLHRFEHVTA
jgi:heme-degrading monooxygenase HmoA